MKLQHLQKQPATMVDLALPEKIKMMTRVLLFLISISLFASCRSTRKIGTAIAKKDTVLRVTFDSNGLKRSDTLNLIKSTLNKVDSNLINFTTFTGKLDVDYRGSDDKNFDLNVHVRMLKDSIIWLNVNATLLSIDVMRVMITKDSVKLLNRREKVYTARSVDYLQDVTQLPLDLKTVQDLIIGNPVFIDSNIVSYTSGNGVTSLLSVGEWFKTLITLSEPGKTLTHIKLDDADVTRNRTADLTYNDYENKKGMPFSTKRRIAVTEKKRLDIKIDFKQYEFNGDVSFPFSVPKNYDRD
jgi:hypothetical protein